MAQSSTIYRMKLELSDINRYVYESLDFRVAQHPSEGEDRLVARILAYALLYEEHLEFGKGLSSSEEPALSIKDLTGQLLHWIDVGTPSGERVHSASKKAQDVTIVCHKGQDALARELGKKKIHRAEKVDVVYLEPSFVTQLAKRLERNAEWVFLRSDDMLTVTVGEDSISGHATLASLPS